MGMDTCKDVWVGTGTCDAAGISAMQPTGMTIATTATTCTMEKCNVKCSTQHATPSVVIGMCTFMKTQLPGCDVACVLPTAAPTSASFATGLHALNRNSVFVPA